MRRFSEVFVWFIGTSNECHTRGDNLPRQWKSARGPSACWSVRQMGEYGRLASVVSYQRSS